MKEKEDNFETVKENKCTCGENCTCGCQEGKKCTCEDCNCTEDNCSCEDCDCTEDNCSCEECDCTEDNCGCEDCDCEDCKCDEECDCDEDCDCEGCDCEVEEQPEKKKGSFFHRNDKGKDEIDALKMQVKDLEEKNLRAKAELVNYRKRKDEEVTRLYKYCNEDMIKELLSTVDNFERAIGMDDDNLEDEVSKFLSGFKMIYCNFEETLKKYGVTEIATLHQPFDPAYHQAVLTDKVDGVESGIITEVMQKGYMLKDKVIRPSMVKVNE